MDDDVSDDELVAALAPLSLRSRLDPPAVARIEGRGVQDPDDVAALVEHVERGLFASPFSPATDLGPDRRQEVAGSVAFQAVVAQVANPVLLAHRVLGIGLYPVIGDVRWRPDDWVVRYGLAELRRGGPMPTRAVLDRLHQQITGFLADAVNEALPRPLPGRLLVGNARAAIHTALVAVGEAPAEPFARDTCCLIHLAGLAPCAECPLEGPAG
ncbi:hypothetical protein ACE2AJ_08860 [Aquihabitans daechungensis]|uniref:hypothetical protein n=1 Tax=Aquihabitans daechungensis TaxID=1052257 RepID=UPI003BA15C6C